MKPSGNRRFVCLTAQLANDVEKRSSLRSALSPFRVREIVSGAAGTKAPQCGQQQKAIRSYRQSRMTRYRQFASHLGLPYTQQIFLIAMIDFNLPTIKTCLDQELGGRFLVSRQKVSRLTIIQAR